MTAPAKLKLTIYQGATFRKRLTWKGPLPAQTPIDLTGCTARMQVRPEVESSTVLLELTTANGGITLGGVAGTIELFVSDDDSAAFTWQSGSWDLGPGNRVPRRRCAQACTGLHHLVGTWMLEDDLPGALTPSGAALEGNFKIFLDGSSTPSYEASGTEDYFLLGFYGLSVPGYSWSGQVGMTFRSANITTSFYRLHVRDPIEFSNGLKITWNCGDTSQVAFTGNARVWATTYYYTEG